MQIWGVFEPDLLSDPAGSAGRRGVRGRYLSARMERHSAQRPGAFRSWLGRIARNLSLDRFRARRAQKRGGEGTELLLSELEQCIPSGERDWEERELAQLLDSFLRGRTEIARLIFLRRYWYGDDIRQMAERFSVGESYIKSSLFRTRKALRQYLEKEGVSL